MTRPISLPLSRIFANVRFRGSKKQRKTECRKAKQQDKPVGRGDTRFRRKIS
jgi:hypothetical protein